RLYTEAGGTAKINRVSIGAGTDAAFAALETKAPVIGGMGLRNFGALTNNAEYVNNSSIEPRLYLLTRLIIDIAAGRASPRLPCADQRAHRCALPPTAQDALSVAHRGP
nr:hypothetical protein [Acidobacteriota bacterium]